MKLWLRRCPAETPRIQNEQGIAESLTESNRTRVWASRRTEEDKLYVVHVQRISGIGLPNTLVVKKLENINPALQVDDNVRNRCKSEMILLNTICHDNIIKLLGVIKRDEALMLVYKFEPNGSLDYWMHKREGAERPLSWPERKAIAIGVAKGLYHLQHECKKPIVHHNINSNNILLDQNFNAVIASFGSAQMHMDGLDQPLPITDLPLGNFGYAAPEYATAASQLTEKVDNYSFGVLMLELVTGRAAMEAGPDGHLALWAHNFTGLIANQDETFHSAVDRDIPDQARYMEEMATVFSLGVDCTIWDPRQRPSMRTALKRLHGNSGRGPFRGFLNCYLL